MFGFVKLKSEAYVTVLAAPRSHPPLCLHNSYNVKLDSWPHPPAHSAPAIAYPMVPPVSIILCVAIQNACFRPWY